MTVIKLKKGSGIINNDYSLKNDMAGNSINMGVDTGKIIRNINDDDRGSTF